MTALFDFSVRDLRGGMQDLAQYRDRVTLVVNTASRCFFASQFDGLEKLQRDYEDRGFTVLAFPCDQFGHQEPLDDAEIEEFCRHEAGVTFPVFSKIEVNGPGADPLYRWLTTQGGGLVGGRIAWNFTKFLVGRDGKVVRRYAPPIPPARIARRIEQTLPALAA